MTKKFNANTKYSTTGKFAKGYKTRETLFLWEATFSSQSGSSGLKEEISSFHPALSIIEPFCTSDYTGKIRLELPQNRKFNLNQSVFSKHSHRAQYAVTSAAVYVAHPYIQPSRVKIQNTAASTLVTHAMIY